MQSKLWQTRELNQWEQTVIDSLRLHVAHGHGEIVIQVRPGSLRIQEGLGHVFELARS